MNIHSELHISYYLKDVKDVTYYIRLVVSPNYILLVEDNPEKNLLNL